MIYMVSIATAKAFHFSPYLKELRQGDIITDGYSCFKHVGRH